MKNKELSETMAPNCFGEKETRVLQIPLLWKHDPKNCLSPKMSGQIRGIAEKMCPAGSWEKMCISEILEV